MGDFAYLSDDEQVAWRLPISLMLDMSLIRRQHSVITVAEYLKLHQLDLALEVLNGSWSESAYHGGPFKPTLHALTQEGWDSGFVRVDRELLVPTVEHDSVYDALHAQLGEGTFLSLGQAQDIVRGAGLASWKDDAEFGRILSEHGWEALYTFRGSYVEMFKAVTDWDIDVAPRDNMRGLVDELAHSNADVVHVRGETHWNRKAGQLRFTTSAGRTHFADLVLHGVHRACSLSYKWSVSLTVSQLSRLYALLVSASRSACSIRMVAGNIWPRTCAAATLPSSAGRRRRSRTTLRA